MTMSDGTAKTADVAKWMVEKIDKDKNLYQSDAANGILTHFGKSFIYENENGSLAIDRAVLKKFREMTEDSVVWDAYMKYWRLREATDQPGKRQVD